MSGTDIETGAPAADDFADPTANAAGLKPIAETTPREFAAGGVAAVAIGTAVLAIVFEGGYVVSIAGILSCLIGPYAYYQQTKLTDIRTLQETHEAAKREVGRLTEENERLKASVEDLKATVGRLEDVEQALDVITQTQGQSVSAFADQVEENKQILARMQSNLRSNVLQNILNVILRSDVDGDYKIDSDEVDNIIHRIENIGGVNVNDEKFRSIVEEAGGNINAVMKVLKNLMKADDLPPEEKIFIIEE